MPCEALTLELPSSNTHDNLLPRHLPQRPHPGAWSAGGWGLLPTGHHRSLNTSHHRGANTACQQEPRKTGNPLLMTKTQRAGTSHLLPELCHLQSWGTAASKVKGIEEACFSETSSPGLSVSLFLLQMAQQSTRGSGGVLGSVPASWWEQQTAPGMNYFSG